MLGQSTLKELFDNIIKTTFVKGVYHSVSMKPLLKGASKPAAPVDGRFKSVGVEDTEGFSCYCRQTGPLQVQKIEKVGSCNQNIHRSTVPHRLVFFNDIEKRDHDSLTAILMKAVMKTPKIHMVSVNTDPEAILKLEAPAGKFTFKIDTYYVCINFDVFLDVKADNCEQEIVCEGVANPYCGQI